MLGFGPISDDPISELPRFIVFFDAEGLFRIRMQSPVQQVTGNPRVRLVFAVEITVLPILGEDVPVLGDEIP
jgi:hypothetical protein